MDVSIFDTDSAGQRGRVLRQAWGIPEHALLIGKVAAVTSEVKRHDLFIRAAGLLAIRFSDRLLLHPSVKLARIAVANIDHFFLAAL